VEAEEFEFDNDYYNYCDDSRDFSNIDHSSQKEEDHSSQKERGRMATPRRSITTASRKVTASLRRRAMRKMKGMPYRDT